MSGRENRIEVMGCPVDNLGLEETLRIIDGMIRSGKPHQHVVVNVDKLLKLRKDPALHDIIATCDIINADGMPVVWASRLLGTPIKERVAGIDLMENLIRVSPEKGYRLYFLGARKEIVEKVVSIYTERYRPVIAGFRDGYWSAEEEAEVARTVSRAKPDILFMAVSSPKKEFFLRKYLSVMNVPFVMGVGGSFDVVAGLKKRAPVWMQKSGLEWLYRLIQEPGRMWKRYLFGNSRFLILFSMEFVRKVLKPGKRG